jgi:hypothetical protein
LSTAAAENSSLDRFSGRDVKQRRAGGDLISRRSILLLDMATRTTGVFNSSCQNTAVSKTLTARHRLIRRLLSALELHHTRTRLPRHHSHGRLQVVLSPRPRAARPSHAVPTPYETTRGARIASPIEGLVDMCRRDPVASLGSHGTGARTHQRCVWLCRVSRQMCQDAPAAR